MQPVRRRVKAGISRRDDVSALVTPSSKKEVRGCEGSPDHHKHSRAFSSEVGTGSREENAKKQKN
jgi:hypothetical protein